MRATKPASCHSSTMGMGGCNANFKNCAPIDPAASGGPPFSLLDGVSLTGSAPEPSTWAMMFIGFAGLAYAGFETDVDRRFRPREHVGVTLKDKKAMPPACGRHGCLSRPNYRLARTIRTVERTSPWPLTPTETCIALIYAAARLGVWLAVFAAIFVPIERVFALHSQKIFRKGIAVDLGYYFLTRTPAWPHSRRRRFRWPCL